MLNKGSVLEVVLFTLIAGSDESAFLETVREMEPVLANTKGYMRDLVEEAKLGCMTGMLLCLNREQRLVFILGELFAVDHTLGGELLSITPANFRKRLERARRDLCQRNKKRSGNW